MIDKVQEWVNFLNMMVMSLPQGTSWAEYACTITTNARCHYVLLWLQQLKKYFVKNHFNRIVSTLLLLHIDSNNGSE